MQAPTYFNIYWCVMRQFTELLYILLSEPPKSPELLMDSVRQFSSASGVLWKPVQWCVPMHEQKLIARSECNRDIPLKWLQSFCFTFFLFPLICMNKHRKSGFLVYCYYPFIVLTFCLVDRPGARRLMKECPRMWLLPWAAGLFAFITPSACLFSFQEVSKQPGPAQMRWW